MDKELMEKEAEAKKRVEELGRKIQETKLFKLAQKEEPKIPLTGDEETDVENMIVAKTALAAKKAILGGS